MFLLAEAIFFGVTYNKIKEKAKKKKKMKKDVKKHVMNTKKKEKTNKAVIYKEFVKKK